MDYTKITLGELLSYKNETVKRNAMSILKTLQKQREQYCEHGHLMEITDETETHIAFECFKDDRVKIVKK